MSSTHNPGRVAGFLYLLLVVAAPLRLIYIPSKLFVHGNATATANNIAAHELLFRLGIFAQVGKPGLTKGGRIASHFEQAQICPVTAQRVATRTGMHLAVSIRRGQRSRNRGRR
jgi:uncharacterized protein DUF4386